MCMSKEIVLKIIEEVRSPLHSALVKSHMKFFIHFWACQYSTDVEIMVRVHQKATKMVKGTCFETGVTSIGNVSKKVSNNQEKENILSSQR